MNYQLATRYVAEAMGWSTPEQWERAHGGDILLPYQWRDSRGKTRMNFLPHERIEDAYVIEDYIARLGGRQQANYFVSLMGKVVGAELAPADFRTFRNWGFHFVHATPKQRFDAICKVLLTEEQLQECGMKEPHNE